VLAKIRFCGGSWGWLDPFGGPETNGLRDLPDMVRGDREPIMTLRLFRFAGLAGIVLTSPLGVVLAVTPAQAVEYPWCSNFHDGAGSTCGFTSYEQCMQTARGSGGYCAPNDVYTGPADRPQARRPARRHPADKPASQKD
jgi:uncharacterized protein DUF3551